jgi:hypothetical protein
MLTVAATAKSSICARQAAPVWSALPGDIFGVEAGDVHLSSAEAICDSQILVVEARRRREIFISRRRVLQLVPCLESDRRNECPNARGR